VTGSVTITGSGSFWDNHGSLYVGRAGNGTLNITDGATVTNITSYIGYESNSTGVVNVDGFGSMWAPGNPLYVGYSGNGTLNVTNSSIVSSTYCSIGASGKMMVDGSSAKFPSLYIGGGLTISGGGIVDSNRNSHINSGSGVTGIVTVDGIGSKWNAIGLTVGDDSNAILNIINGGAVDSVNFYNDPACIGFSAGSTSFVTVDGANSTWTHSSDLYVGHYGNGTLQISGGAAVSITDTTYVADGADSAGIITFGHGGGTLTTGSLMASPSELAGTGTILAHGLVSDVDLVFDSTASLTQNLKSNSPGQNITLILDMASNPVSNRKLGAGWLGNGSLTIKNGVEVVSRQGYIGYHYGSTGVVTVDGVGSKWTESDSDITHGIFVGYYGNGSLIITGGGAVSSISGSIGAMPNSVGKVSICGSGSMWQCGTLTINGTMNISDGGNVTDDFAHIGGSGLPATVTVHGAGSYWRNSTIDIGTYSTGTLYITDGATVRDSYYGYIGKYSGSQGLVTVDGIDSKWTNMQNLYIGYSGKATLNIAGGGAVTAKTGSINSQSLLAIDVGNDSSFIVGGGSGALANNGNVRILAGAIPTASATFTPISAASTWGGSGTYEAVGGTWDATSHVFTASAVQTGTAGAAITIDLNTKQRILATDGPTGKSVGASFLAKSAATPMNLNFTASLIGGTPLANLQALIGNNQTIYSAWQFAADGSYTTGEPAYLSFDIGTGHDRDLLQVWHYDGSAWSPFDAIDLTCNGPYASFTVTGFSGYAVTTPEPGTLALLLIAAMGLAGYFARPYAGAR
jgi:T5SS/PEP-CTERM-associated repeat protein